MGVGKNWFKRYTAPIKRTVCKVFVLLSMQLVGSELEPEHPVHTRKRTLAKRNAEKFLDKKAYDVEKNSILGSSTDANAANSADHRKRDTEHA